MSKLKEYRDNFYSNCILEAFKAKVKKPSCKLYFCFGRVDGVPIPHVFWMDCDYYYNFYTDDDVHLYNILWHMGRIERYHKSEMHRKLYSLF